MKSQASSPTTSGETTQTPRYWLTLILALGVILVWGASFSVTRVAVREIPPLTLAFLRFALASLMLWPLTFRLFRKTAIARKDRLPIFNLGFVGVTLYFASENFSLKFTTASHGALIIATIPLCTELAMAYVQRRRPAPLILVGMGISFAGVFVIFGRNGGGGASLLGDLLMIGAVLSWIWYSFIAERLVSRYPNLLLTFLIMLTGALTLLPLTLIELYFVPMQPPSAGSWAGVVFLGVFCSALAYHFWNRAIPALGVTATNNLLYGIPLVGVLTGVVFLDEPLTASVLIGGVLIICGLVLANRAGRVRKDEG